MEAVYFAFGLLAVALVIGIILKRTAPQETPAPVLEAEAAPENAVVVTSSQDDYKHITALRESVAAREQQERTVGSVLLSSGVSSDAHEKIREMVTRLQSLSGTPSEKNSSQ